MLRPATLLSLLALAPPLAAQCDELEIVSPEPTLVGEFGFAIASSGDFALVGSPGAAVSGFGTGAAFVFERGLNGYGFVDRLEPSDLPIGGEFGNAVAIDGARAIVGAERVGLPDDHGAAYLYELQSGAWNEVARLAPPPGIDFFGHAVAISGDIAAVGASSSVFVYERDTLGVWNLATRIDAPPLALFFGASVALDGDTLAVGAPEDISTGLFSGALYLYDGASAWGFAQQLVPGAGVNGGGFGASVSVDGPRLAVGEPAPITPGNETGSVHVYEHAPGGWVEITVLSTGETSEASFGRSLDLDGDRLLVGQPDASGIGALAGTAFLFERTGGTWTLQARMDALAPSFQQRFGFAVALGPEGALVGSPHDDDAFEQAGSFYLYERANGVATSCHCASAPCANSDAFGGCGTALGPGAIVSAWGSASVARDDLLLQTTYARPGQSGLVFMGSSTHAPLPLGNGLRCVGGALFRFPVRAIDASGCMQEGPGLVARSQSFHGGAILAGSTWSFQSWFRDPSGACGASSNLSNALSVPFVP